MAVRGAGQARGQDEGETQRPRLQLREDSPPALTFNAVKYASCLAVIGCSVCIQMAELDGVRRGVGAWHGTFWNVSEDAWWKTWICLLCLKTAFTFAWDVVVDWGLARVGCDGRAARVGCLCPCCDDGLDSDMDTDGGGGDSDDERDSGHRRRSR